MLILTFSGTWLEAQRAGEIALGIAWQVHGRWKSESRNEPILTGDLIPPGSLLRPDESAGSNSITVLLPDGQRILYECFTTKDCSRGFRVPQLYRKPDPFAVDMLARIHAVLIRERQDVHTIFHRDPSFPRDQVVAVLGPDNRIEVGGLAAHLSNGRYSYNLQPLNVLHPRQSRIAIEKTGAEITLSLPGPGLYEATIIDDLNNPRMDLFIAAVRSGRASDLTKSFSHAKALMNQWNEDYQGWPVQDFQRAYLESQVLDVKPATQQAVHRSAGDESGAANVTAEPEYSPRPGVFDKDVEVMLRCDTPRAVIHYTVDNSQPMDDSPVYTAPVVVKGTELTIKAFASAPGKKDSAVVTGIFRIKE